MIDIDDSMRAKLRALRLSTFADVFFELLNDEAYADALPEAIFLMLWIKLLINVATARSPWQSTRLSSATRMQR